MWSDSEPCWFDLSPLSVFTCALSVAIGTAICTVFAGVFGGRELSSQLTSLHSQELERYKSFKHDRRKTSFLLGRLSAKHALSGWGGVSPLRKTWIDSGIFEFPIVKCEELSNVQAPGGLNHQIYFQYGAAVERSGDIDKAAQLFQKSLERIPEDDRQDEFRATVLNYLGYMWIENDKNIDVAGELVKKAAKLNPDSGAIADSSVCRLATATAKNFQVIVNRLDTINSQ